MKLFQKLLLAPAAIGLFSPIVANASEANLIDVSSYSQKDVVVNQDTFKPLSMKNPLLAGGEGMAHSHDDDGFDGDTFSSTTSASFSADFAIGAISETSDEKVGATYGYQIDLTTSFTGSDSLDVSIDAGEGGATLTELDLNETGDKLTVDGIGYTRQLGDRLTVFFGDSMDGGTLFTTSCVYGGQTNTLDDCGNLYSSLASSNGSSAGASFDLGNGFAAAFGYTGEGNSSNGLLTDEGLDAYALNASYTGDSFGASFSYSDQEGYDESSKTNFTFSTYALNAYFTPDLENFPSISVGFEAGHVDDLPSSRDNTSHYFVGLQWDELGNGSLGAAVGTKTPKFENGTEELMYEAFYSYNYADGITITPLIYVKESSAAGADDETGLILKTSFSF